MIPALAVQAAHPVAVQATVVLVLEAVVSEAVVRLEVGDCLVISSMLRGRKPNNKI